MSINKSIRIHPDPNSHSGAHKTNTEKGKYKTKKPHQHVIPWDANMVKS